MSDSKQYPVVEGTRAHRAWCNYYREVLHTVAPFTRSIVLASGKPSRGFYAPSLFPPEQQLEKNSEGAA